VNNYLRNQAKVVAVVSSFPGFPLGDVYLYSTPNLKTKKQPGFPIKER
jgi:hypothetical protein